MIKFYAAIVFLLLFITGCGDGYLRGDVIPSPDGKTYFAIIDDNGGHCGPILMDGKKWQYAINEIAPISPGVHKIECGAEIEFEIPEGMIFKFNYWGP